MIPISSQSPTLPSHNSLNYELLSLTAICGEVPCAGSSRLTAGESYRKKVVTSLTHDKLLRIFSSHHLRGYRLGVRTKRLLLQQEPERFAFYLSGCSDMNAIKSEVPRRIRLHRIAQTYVTMLNAGTMIYRDEKPPIFSPAASGPFHIEQPYFYDSREMKEAELEMLKIRGSRMAGALFTSNRVFAVYNSMEFLPVFEPQVEQRAKAMLELLEPGSYDYLFTAEAKSIPLIHEMARQSGAKKYFIARKGQKVYMPNPIHVEDNSITTVGTQRLFLGSDDAALIRGKRIVLMDDVISTGGSLLAMEHLVELAGGTVVDRIAVLADGHLQALDRPEAVYASGILSKIFGVSLSRTQTGQGWQYYYDYDLRSANPELQKDVVL